jgi:DNA-binding XRE family transcriptional regulator
MIACMKSSKSGKTSSHEEVWSKIEANYSPEELLGLLPFKAVESALQFKRSLAEQIRSKREAAGLTQRELAKLASISQRDVSFLEQSKGNPTITTVSRILHVLDLKLQIKNA